MATIMSNTINITYNGTTRPVTYVWNPNVYFHEEMDRHYWALTLYSFKDMIPDYQEYLQMSVYIDYRTQRNATFKLPVLNYNYTVETIGHGEVKGVYYNKHYTGYCPISCILDQIEKELGIKRQLIKLIDHDGNEINKHIVADHPNLTIFAVFDSLETKMEEKGIEKELNYVSKFREGETLYAYKCANKDRLFDLFLVEFRQSPYVIEKRTPKFIKIRDTRTDITFRKKITKGKTFEEYVYLGSKDLLVMKESNIKLNTLYNVDTSIRY